MDTFVGILNVFSQSIHEPETDSRKCSGCYTKSVELAKVNCKVTSLLLFLLFGQASQQESSITSRTELWLTMSSNFLPL
jgi:hypothetical protein